MRLIIAEKPSVGRAIAEALGIEGRGKGCIGRGKEVVTWCVGHLLEQLPPEGYSPAYARWARETLPMVPEHWKLRPREGAEEQLEVIKRLLSKAREVVHAGDPDREGQLLVDEVLEHLGWKGPVRRVLINSMDADAIRRAFGRLADNSEPRFVGLSQSALCRSRADWLVGMNVTRALTLRGRERGVGRVLHAGRVQTPTLALVAQREKAIEAFVPTDYWTPVVTVEHANGRFDVRWVPRDEAGVDSEGRIVDESLARRLAEAARGASGCVAAVSRRAKSEPAPMPWKLATLQSAAAKRLQVSPDETLAIVQRLYEAGHVTYPRTESEYLPPDLLGDAPATLNGLGGWVPAAASADPKARRHRAWNANKCPVHHAIVPTPKVPRAGSLKGNDAAVYEMIATRYVGLFLPPCELEITEVTVELADERWRARGRRIVSGGWREALGVDAKEALIPAVEKGDPVTGVEAKVEASQTKPPDYFTEGTLIEAMEHIHRFVDDEKLRKRLKETAGLGTGATRDRILADLIRRGYLRREGRAKRLRVTEDGWLLIAAAPPDVASPGLTALWEEYLQAIEQGSGDPERFMTATRRAVEEMVRLALGAEIAAQPAHECPQCGRAMRRVKGRNGHFWGCTGYPECQTTLPDEGGKPGARRPREPAKRLGPCPSCKEGERVERTVRKRGRNRGRRFLCCTRRECDYFEWVDETHAAEAG